MCKVVLFLSSALVMFSLVATAVGIWLDYWFIEENKIGTSTTTIRAGLWTRCTKTSTTSEVCDSYDDTNTTVVPDSLQTVRILVLTGAALLLLAVETLFIKCMLMGDQKRFFTMFTAFISIIGAPRKKRARVIDSDSDSDGEVIRMTLLASVIVYGTLTRGQLGIEITELYAGFGLVVAGASVSIIAGILLCVSKERNEKKEED